MLSSENKNRFQSGNKVLAPFSSLLARLEAFSQKPDFQFQRELAFSQFLRPYLARGQ